MTRGCVAHDACERHRTYTLLSLLLVLYNYAAFRDRDPMLTCSQSNRGAFCFAPCHKDRSVSKVIEATAFSCSPHANGPVLAVLRNGLVECNIRLNPSLIWALSRSLQDALSAQAAFEHRREQARAHENQQG
jgi:hypothetical protein